VLTRRRKRRRKTGIADLGIFVLYAEERAGLFEATIKNNGNLNKKKNKWASLFYYVGTFTGDRERERARACACI